MSKSKRDDRIRALLAQGVELQAVARRFHLSSTRIAQIRDGKSGGRKKLKTQLIHVEPIPQADSLELLAHTVAGNVFAVIEGFARTARVPSAVLAERVFRLLSATIRR